MITVQSIHHISINVTELVRSKIFYQQIVGLQEIERPPFDFPGAWYAIGDTGQQLHLIVHNGETTRTRGIDTRDGHFAIRINDYSVAIAWLEQHRIEYKAKPDSMTGFAQIFFMDPDRNIIELNSER